VNRWLFKNWFLAPVCKLIGHGQCGVFVGEWFKNTRIVCLRCGSIFNDRRRVDRCPNVTVGYEKNPRVWDCRRNDAYHDGPCAMAPRSL
jgi:hypothetical protein